MKEWTRETIFQTKSEILKTYKPVAKWSSFIRAFAVYGILHYSKL